MVAIGIAPLTVFAQKQKKSGNSGAPPVRPPITALKPIDVYIDPGSTGDIVKLRNFMKGLLNGPELSPWTQGVWFRVVADPPYDRKVLLITKTPQIKNFQCSEEVGTQLERGGKRALGDFINSHIGGNSLGIQSQQTVEELAPNAYTYCSEYDATGEITVTDKDGKTVWQGNGAHLYTTRNTNFSGGQQPIIKLIKGDNIRDIFPDMFDPVNNMPVMEIPLDGNLNGRTEQFISYLVARLAVQNRFFGGTEAAATKN